MGAASPHHFYYMHIYAYVCIILLPVVSVESPTLPNLVFNNVQSSRKISELKWLLLLPAFGKVHPSFENEFFLRGWNQVLSCFRSDTVTLMKSGTNGWAPIL